MGITSTSWNSRQVTVVDQGNGPRKTRKFNQRKGVNTMNRRAEVLESCVLQDNELEAVSGGSPQPLPGSLPGSTQLPHATISSPTDVWNPAWAWILCGNDSCGPTKF